MTISITEVRTRPDLKKWVTFPLGLYRGDPNFIPQLTRDELDFFSPEKNPSFKIADTKLVLASRNGNVVGRVCGIIHTLEAQKLGYRRGRFGWFECVDDPEVSSRDARLSGGLVCPRRLPRDDRAPRVFGLGPGGDAGRGV